MSDTSISLSGTKATASLGSFMTYPFQSILAGFLENSYTSASVIAQNYGYSSMFTGVITLVLFQLYFLNHKIPLRERISALCLFSFYIICSSFSITYTLLHGGREPTWFPTRYSFAIGFIVCFFSAREMDEFDSTPVYAPFLPIIIGIASTIYLKFTTYNVTYNSLGKYNLSIVSLILYYGTTLIVLAYALINDLKPRLNKTIVKESFASILLILSAISSYRGTNVVFKNNVKKKEFQNINTYRRDDMYTSDFELVKSLEKNKTYRMEATFNRPGNYNEIDNNPMFYSYNGLSHFSSNELKDVENFMLNFGFHYNGFFEKYNAGSTVAINSFLNIKYLIDDSNNHSTKPKFINQYPYEKLDLSSKNEGINFYENKFALPFGMITSKLEGNRIKDYDVLEDHVKWYDHFEYQNSLFKMICNNIVDEDGKQKDIFKKIETVSLETSDGLTYETRADNLNYYTGPKGSSIDIKYKVPSGISNYNLYFCEKNLSENVYYTFDNNPLTISNYWDKGIKPIRETYNRNHHLTMTLRSDLNSSYLLDEFYYEDLDVLKEYIDEIKKQGSENIKEVKGITTYGFEGDYLINKDNQYILFTLPYEKYMHIYVDGKEVKAETKLNIFTAADLSSFSKGMHKIKIVYQDKTIEYGSIASIIGLLMIGSGTFLYIKIENIVINKIKERRKEDEQN